MTTPPGQAKKQANPEDPTPPGQAKKQAKAEDPAPLPAQAPPVETELQAGGEETTQQTGSSSPNGKAKGHEK